MPLISGAEASPTHVQGDELRKLEGDLAENDCGHLCAGLRCRPHRGQVAARPFTAPVTHTPRQEAETNLYLGWHSQQELAANVATRRGAVPRISPTLSFSR